MDKKTFVQLKPGDILYTVTVKDSKLVNGSDIKVVRVKNAEKSEDIPYMMQVELEGVDEPLFLNWNCDVSLINLPDENSKKRKYVEGFNFTVYSTDPRECKRLVREKNESAICKLGEMEMMLNEKINEIHNELVKLSGIRIISGELKLKKVEELITDVVYV